jgi:G3E family GTPase
MSALPVSVITGFLGSGKTTLLSRLLRDPAFERTAVIINEFGAVGLDHLLVESSDEQILVLEGGCVCCTVRGDLVRTAGDLLARRATGAITPFERIVIETTGLADPAPIVHALMTDRDIAEALRLEAVITTIDAATGAATLDRHPQSIKQAALADRIVLTKTDLADPEVNGLAERLQALNPAAPKLTALHGAVDATRLFERRAYDPARYDRALFELPAHRHGGVNTFCLRREKPLHAATLSLFLQLVAEHCGARLLRMKGLVDVVESPGRPAVIHGVQHVFHPPAWLDAWPDEERSTRIVVISQGLEAQWVQDLLEVLDDEVKACSIS